jgi:hypothetical protein
MLPLLQRSGSDKSLPGMSEWDKKVCEEPRHSERPHTAEGAYDHVVVVETRGDRALIRDCRDFAKAKATPFRWLVNQRPELESQNRWDGKSMPR